MAPRKPAAKESSRDKEVEDPTALILAYLRTQNRPYSATEISSNLHNKVTKTKTDKLLKEMYERKEIMGKTVGKASVYWGLQDKADAATPEELAALDAQINALRESVPSKKALLKTKTSQLVALRAEPTTSTLNKSIGELEAKKVELEMGLMVLRSEGVKPVSKEEKTRTESEFKRWKKAMMERKAWCEEVVGMLMDGGMSKEDVWDACGLEEDP